MQYGVKLEKDMVIYIDHMGSEREGQWQLCRGGYQLSHDYQKTTTAFLSAAAKLDEPIYSYSYNGRGTIWVTASYRVPLSFVGPFGSFVIALRHAHIERNCKLGAETLSELDAPVKIMIEDYFQKSFHEITWDDLSPAWNINP